MKYGEWTPREERALARGLKRLQSQQKRDTGFTGIFWHSAGGRFIVFSGNQCCGTAETIEHALELRERSAQ